MKFKVIGSGSGGNCYLFDTGAETLIVEAGKSFLDVKKALDFEVGRIVGCLVSHEHKDHSKYVGEMLESGIDVFASAGTIEAMDVADTVNLHIVIPEIQFRVGGFDVIGYSSKHDAAEPLCFLFRHKECGTVLFATDTYYLRQRFRGLNNILIECNYDKSVLLKNYFNGIVPKPLYERLLSSHMGLDTCLKMLGMNDLREVNNIVLIHISSVNGDASAFRDAVQLATGKMVTSAYDGLEMDFDKYGV